MGVNRWYRIFRRIRQIWIVLGVSATIIFIGWSLIAYRANSEARFALRSDLVVDVKADADGWRFVPTKTKLPTRVGLLFLPGALVDPIAYAPIARAVAKAGYPAYILKLPRRGAFGGADDPHLMARAITLITYPDTSDRWVLAGHSRGAVIVSELASHNLRGVAGVIFIGTSHPRDVSLASLRMPVLKIIGTLDGLASIKEVEANRSMLPASTEWVYIEGGNHSQFGWYGFQPGDKRASIAPAKQRAQMMAAILAMLRSYD